MHGEESIPEGLNTLIETTYLGKSIGGSFMLRHGFVIASCQYGSATAPLGGIPVRDLATLLIRELAKGHLGSASD